MSNQEQDFAPHPSISLKRPNDMFLVLEELGIAWMQYLWVQQARDIEESEAKKIEEQAHEFFDDLCHLMNTPADGERIENDGWAGLGLVDHLNDHWPEDSKFMKKPEKKEELVAAVLTAYTQDLKILLKLDEQANMMGKKLDPVIYIGLMKGWAEYLTGKENTINRPMEVEVVRARG